MATLKKYISLLFILLILALSSCDNEIDKDISSSLNSTII